MTIFISGGRTSANFLSFPTFSNRFTPMQLEMTHNGKFGQKSGLDWVKTGHFCIFFYLFPQNEAEIDSEWSISPDSQLSPSFATTLIFGEISKIFQSAVFTAMQLEIGKFGQISGLHWVKMAIFIYFSIFSHKMRLRLTQNGQFHLIHNFSHLLSPDSQLFPSFATKASHF